jgi:hypothetical protein
MKHTKNLSVVLLNAQGIQSANSFTQKVSQKKKKTFIAICETWLDSYEIKSFHLDGYKIATFFSRSKSSIEEESCYWLKILIVTLGKN